MPKYRTPAPLYNHDERPFTATSWATDSQAPPASQNVHLPPPRVEDYDDTDYAMPLDGDLDQQYEPLPEKDMLSGGLPGIQVLPKLRAKRYLNSVRFFLLAF